MPPFHVGVVGIERREPAAPALLGIHRTKRMLGVGRSGPGLALLAGSKARRITGLDARPPIDAADVEQSRPGMERDAIPLRSTLRTGTHTRPGRRKGRLG